MIIRSLILVIIGSLILSAQSYAESLPRGNSTDVNWEQQKLEAQKKSTEMRKEYYEKYKTKGYDVSLLTSDILDGSKTTESQFWDALKQVQNNKEIPERKMYVDKLRLKGLDVSGFTDDVINDSGRFWEMYKKVESGASNIKDTPPVEKKEYQEKKEYTEQKKEYTEPKPPVKSDSSVEKKSNLSPAMEKIRKSFITRLDKIPTEKREVTLKLLEKNIQRQISVAREKSNTALMAKLEVLLSVVQERMGALTDDEALIDSLFRE